MWNPTRWHHVATTGAQPFTGSHVMKPTTSRDDQVGQRKSCKRDDANMETYTT